MKQRFEELLPFYVNKTLAAADRSWVEDYLRQHPKSLGEMQWYQSLQSVLLQDSPAVSSEVGLERAMTRIRAERVQKAPAEPMPTRPWGERAREWLAGVLPQPVLRPALAGALVVVVAQSVVIGTLTTEQDSTTELRAVKGSVVDVGPYLKVNFNADAREADIRFLLVEVNGSLAAGPGQLGDWYVRIPESKVDAVAEKLKASSIIEAVARVDALPVRR